MPRPRVYVTRHLPGHALDYLSAQADVDVWEGELPPPRKELLEQAHISNFLNRKRGLSLEGMDKVLLTQHLSVLDLLNPDDVNRRVH